MKIAFTVCTANYLAQAKTLGDSLLTHNPDYIFIIGLLDRVDGRFDADFFQPHHLLEIEKVNIPYFAEMNGRYDMFELSNALKPYVAEYLLQHTSNIKVLLYLDSDMMVFNRFDHVEKCLIEQSICLTPHILTPIPLDISQPEESNFLNAGIYNGGFFALSPTVHTFSFLTWWKDRLKEKCLHNVCNGLYVDQIWLNLVPLFFHGVHILRHWGYNVAYFNLHERTISIAKGEYLVNGTDPLVIMHFTGYENDKPDQIAKYQTRYYFEYRTDIKPLYDLYRVQLQQSRYNFYNELVPYYKAIGDQAKQDKLNEQKRIQEEKTRFEQQQEENKINALKQELRKYIKKEIVSMYDSTLYGKFRKKVKKIIGF